MDNEYEHKPCERHALYRMEIKDPSGNVLTGNLLVGVITCSCQEEEFARTFDEQCRRQVIEQIQRMGGTVKKMVRIEQGAEDQYPDPDNYPEYDPNNE